MVLQSVAEIVLSRLLDKIFYGITKQNIQVAILQGKFVLSNIGLQPSLLAELNLPIELKHSYVERLEVLIPWREQEVSLTVNISNIYLLAATADFSMDMFEVFMRRKERVIQAALKEFKSNLQRKENKKEAGFIEKLLLSLLDNVNIKIECIHLRCENRDRSYSFGVKINEVSARTVGQDDQPCFFNREKTAQEYIRYVVEMDFMGIYFNSKEDYFLGGRSLAEITDQFHRLSHRRFRNYSENMQSDEASDHFHYIVTISLKTIVKKYIFALERLNKGEREGEEKESARGRERSGDKYLFECAINLRRVQSRLSDQQYYDLLDLVSLISDYQKTYLQYAQHWHLSPMRERRAKDISDLLRKKKLVVVGKREKETLKRNCRKYMGWVFKQTYEEVLKRTFLREAVKKEVTLKHLLANEKTKAIITKTDNEKLRLWVLIALYYRRKYQESVAFFLRGSIERKQRFADQFIDSIQLFKPYQFEQQIQRQRQASNNKYQVFLKLVANIQEFNFQISRENNLGVFIGMQKLRAELTLREKNYQIRLQMEDLQANVFHCRTHQRVKTYVPIINRNCILDRSANLLELTYERNPPAKPFVFTEIDARFQSIEITIYPQAFKQFYEILLGEGGVRKKRSGRRKEGKEVIEEESRSTVRQIGFQKTIIRARVRTPWIVLPLTAANDPAQQCWVARLGDFYVDTPEYDSLQARSQEEIFYQQYKMQLKRFELSYFSSINLFHNWLRFNCSLQTLLKIKAFAGQQILTMIQPFSCFAEFALLKSALSPAIRHKKAKFTAKIMIDEVSIRVSKFLMGRLKGRIDDVLDQGAQRQQQFIQSNVSNIREQNELSGYCKISYEGIQRMNFYCILKGSYMYFFINEQYPKYHFFVHVAQTALRLISNQVENINPQLPKLLVFYLGDKQKHHIWRKKLQHVLNKRTRRMETATANSFRQSNEQRIPQKGKGQEKGEQGQSGSSSKLFLAFLMNKLSIQLFDDKEALFMDCNFKKATLQYSTVAERALKFSLNEWTVCQGNGELFIGSNSFFEQEEQRDEVSNLNNFLEVLCGFNSITEELRVIDIKVDKLFLAWKVELFTRILLFFFYDEEAADAPAPVNPNKRQLQVKISFQKFSFYCYFAQELLALTKLQLISIKYSQNNVEESYVVACKVFEMDKYVDGKRLPMIRRRYLPADGSDPDLLLYNDFNLTYLLRKKETEQFPNIRRLERHYGENILVSQIFCDWKDTEIYFQNELTFRLLNYILGKVLGTVASKFKKREYSSNYIFQSLKQTKLSVFDIVLNNCLFRMPPHQRGFREFSLEVERLRVSKNIDESSMPNEVLVRTIREPLRFFWESMVIKITNAQLNYHVGRQPGIPILSAPLNINFVYAKLNFQREYFVVLKHHDDIDRKATIDVVIEEPVIVQAHKIMFVTFLQLFYQNIKHKDGRGEIFEPPLPFPSLREYAIYIQKVGLNMHYFEEKTNSMDVFSSFFVDRFKVYYKQVGADSSIRLQGETISGTGELPISSLDPRRKKFLLEMQSKEGQMKVVINVEHYALEADLDKVSNLVEFLNYDNDYVSNKIMPKKKSSWQYVNLFAKNCQLRLGALCAEGEFFISYLKGMRNDPEMAAKEYLLSEQALNIVKKDRSKLDWQDLTDKEIKVNGQDLKLSMDGDSIGGASSFYFNRNDLTCKSTNRRFKRESVQVGEGSLHIQLVDLLTLWSVYNSFIRKKSNFVLKTFYEPWDQMPAKLKVVEKRSTEVEMQCLSVSVLPTREAGIARYLRIDLAFPSILYRTYLDEQEVLVNIVFGLWHHKQKMKEVSVGECKSLRIRYLNFKDRKQKSIDIVHGKGIIINVADFSNKVIYNMLQQAKALKQTTRNNLHIDKLGTAIHFSLTLINETGRRVKINVNGLWVLSVPPYQEQYLPIEVDQYLQMLSNDRSFIQIHEQGNPIIRKTSSQINMYSATPVTNSHCLQVHPTSSGCRLVYRPFFTLQNYTSCTMYLKDKRVVRQGEELSVLPNKGMLQFQMNHGGWSKEYRIAITKEAEVFGEDCFVAHTKREEEEGIIQLFDRFVVKNMMPCAISLPDRELPPLQECSLGFLPNSQKAAFPLKVGGSSIMINLLEGNNVRGITKIQKRSKGQIIEEQIAIQIRTEIQTAKKISIINIYTQFGLRNLSNQAMEFQWKDGIYRIGSSGCLLLPLQFAGSRFLEDQQWKEIVFNKNKHCFTELCKFTTLNRLDGKATIVKIQAKHSVRNHSADLIHIQISKDHTEPIYPNHTFFLTPNIIAQKQIFLLFGKYFKKSVFLQKTGSNFLQVQQQFYKLTLLQKEESILLIEDAKAAHKIINNLDNISIIAHAYEQNSGNKLSYSIYEINDDTSIQKLIKPQTSAQIGLFCWNNPKIELEFYLDSRNIEFKQKFTIDFQRLDHKFSHKHVLHDEKDKKNVFFLMVTVQKDKEGHLTVTVYREKDFESLPVQKMKVTIQEISLTFVISDQSIDNVTFECFKASLARQKGIELTQFDIKAQKLLIRQGKNVSVLGALGNSRFLNSHVILSKTAWGIGISSLMVKLTPFQIICRERIIFKVLEKIVEVRAQNPKKTREQLMDAVRLENLKSKDSKLMEETSLIRPEALQAKLEKHWQQVKKQQLKQSKTLIINNLQLSETSLFITYSKEEYKQFDEKIASDHIIKYMLLMPSISELKISVPHLKITDFTGQPKEFAKELVGKLKQSIGSTIANSFSALPFFDNPIIVFDGIFKYIDGMLSIQ